MHDVACRKSFFVVGSLWQFQEGQDGFLAIIGLHESAVVVGYLLALVVGRFGVETVVEQIEGLGIGSFVWQRQDLIPMIDIESTGGLDTDVFCDSLFYFLDLVEEAYRQKPLLYTGRNFYNKHLLGKVDDYKIMIAMYTDQEPVVADDRDITMWQYTGKGRIQGVNGYVDKSRFMGNHHLREIRFKH